MVNNQSNKIEYLMRRREYLLKLRRRASIFQILAVIFLVCGLVTTFVMKAKDFENVYNYLYDRLVEANLKKDPEILNEVLEHLRTMRDTWKEVMHTANAPKTAIS